MEATRDIPATGGVAMTETEILSTLPPVPGKPASPPHPSAPVLVFDACHVGVVLRAVVSMEAVMAVGAMYFTDALWPWINQLALLTAGALPATLAWLLVACALKRPLARLSAAGQYAVGSLLGLVAGVLGCALLALVLPGVAMPWLATAGTGAMLAALLVAGLQMRARARAPAATAARLSELQARIRPHFLFNTLNSAIALVRHEPARAEALLEDLSDLFRHALRDLGESTTLAQELTLAERYLAIEQIRFGPRLQVQWDLDPAAAGARLPPLLLQPLVENAVKHGIETSIEGGTVWVRTQRRGQHARIEIINTLPPQAEPLPTQTPGHGMALANVRDRLKLLHDIEGQFSTGVRDGRYHVRMTLPL